MLRQVFAKMKTSPLRSLSFMAFVTMPLSPLKLLRMSTGLLYNQYRQVSSRLNIARRDKLAQMGCGHTSLDPNGRTTCRAQFNGQETLLLGLRITRL